MELKALTNLHPREYEHPFDTRALDTLERTKGLDMVVKKFYEMGIERILKLQFTGNSLKLTSSSMPELFGLLHEACRILNLPDIPDLYVYRAEGLEAITLGVERPMIVLSSEAVEDLSDEELLFIIGREIGHIKSRHILYQEIGSILPELAEAFSGITMGIGGLVSIGLRYALFYWMQMAEYTADRAGLLACQDITVATGVMAKLAGLPKNYWDTFNLDDFVTQAREFEGFSEKTFDKVLKFLFKNNLWAVARASELFKWTDAGDYQRVLERETEMKRVSSSGKEQLNFCPNCGFKLEAVGIYCPNCGHKLG
jgi:Zn-dependent protease with chaperone function/DNA-directed RNA polymerase subunit RPC12/RpoP